MPSNTTKSRRIIERATRQRIKEILQDEFSLEEFLRLVTRKSIDLTVSGKREIIVCGSSHLSEWDIVEAEAAKIYKRITE